MAMRSLLVLAACVAVRAQNVTVQRLQLQFDVEYELVVDERVEYILEYAPTVVENVVPSRVWVSVSDGQPTRPLLVTARQLTGAFLIKIVNPDWKEKVTVQLLAHHLICYSAVTWQLPYYAGRQLLHELERTLCPASSDDGRFTLHVSWARLGEVTVRVRVTAAVDWQLHLAGNTSTNVTQASPSVFYYQFEEGQQSALLVVRSDDDLCATVSVQNYTCPIAETLPEVSITGLRMTVQRLGAVQVPRSNFPRGFYVVTLVMDGDAACNPEPEDGADWLWEAALFPDRNPQDSEPRFKQVSVSVQPSLSPAQYGTAVGVTAGVFLLVYLAVGALVLLQRWPRCAPLVAPRAVLAAPVPVPTPAPAPASPDAPRYDAELGTSANGGQVTRRGSDATFDSSDMSDTDSEEERRQEAFSPSPAPTFTDADAANVRDGVKEQGGTPFGLPPQLRLAALARRRAGVLRARSDRYLYTLATVAVFYGLPVVQFVVAFQLFMNTSGSLDTCYYNFLCAHPVGLVYDFNHVYSNLGYLVLGALFMLQLQRRKMRRDTAPRDEEYGIPAHYGLLMALGAGMMVVAVLSASYHICPNRLNFQFDTAFMYVLAVLSMVKVYQARHPDVNARAHATFGVLAVLMSLVVWGVLGGGALFWSTFTVLHIFAVLLLSLRIYYLNQFNLEKAREKLAQLGRGDASVLRPLYTARLVMLLIVNSVNWAFALYGLLTQAADFASHLLQVLLGNTLLYMVFYLTMKMVHGERPRWYVWGFVVGAAAAWAPALMLFLSGSSSWASTPAQSRHLNHECRLLSFYDSHDLWHVLSAVALYLSFNVMLTWDDGLAAVRRTEIPVF